MPSAAAIPASPATWTALEAELDAWAASGRAARIWWRDDDATRPGPRLDRLFRLAEDLPLALAVVPATLDPGLAAGLPCGIRVLQHGYAHANHAPPDAKKAEFGDHRLLSAMLAELSAGRDRLESVFGDRFTPVLAPPWNRIGTVAGRIPEAGLKTLSLHADTAAAPGLPHCNVHLDILAWKPAPHFAGPDAVIPALVGRLRSARQAGTARPVGLMTHHRVHDAAGWSFLADLVALLRDHPGSVWTDPFADAAESPA
ncbi:MAG: hypothetical protein AB7G39_10235 [Alphaproteobacteria bacterium]